MATRNGPVSIKDVAQASGVSITTVSFIINGKDKNISEKTIEKVKSTCKELGYEPDRIAASLKTRKTKTIGYITPNIQNPFFSEIAKETETIIAKCGYSIIIANSDDKFEKDRNSIITLASRRVDFIVYAPAVESLTNGNVANISKVLDNTGIPYVIVDRQLLGNLKSKVVCDDQDGGFRAVEHLIENGHRRIACVTGPMNISSAQNRFIGYKAALEKNGIAFDNSIVFHGNFSYESGIEVADELLKAPGITAVFISNDLMAYGITKVMKEKGLQVGEDLSLVGYDNLFYSEILDVPLTSMNQDTKGLAQIIGTHILDVLEHGKPSVIKEVVKSTLVERKSVKCLKGAENA